MEGRKPEAATSWYGIDMGVIPRSIHHVFDALEKVLYQNEIDRTTTNKHILIVIINNYFSS